MVTSRCNELVHKLISCRPPLHTLARSMSSPRLSPQKVGPLPPSTPFLLEATTYTGVTYTGTATIASMWGANGWDSSVLVHQVLAVKVVVLLVVLEVTGVA